MIDYEDEEWRVSPSLPSYEVSNLGRIRCIPYEAPLPNGGMRTYGGKAWYGSLAKDTNRRIFRYKGRTYKVHQLICEAFKGPKPFTKAVVMHLDENSNNNKSENLAWGSQKENLNATGFINYCKNRTGENSPYVKGKTKCLA